VGRLLGVALLLVLYCSLAQASGGACPASSPVAGNNSCFFIAANGSDNNSGTDEASPWQHAPGMPACSGQCLTERTALGGSWNNFGQSHPGVGFIFKGGDTWHFGNPSATPYTGGTYYNGWGGNNNATCAYEGVQTGCFYIGVDTSWFSGGSWTRPIFTGDNPLATSPVASCPFPTIGGGASLPQVPNNIIMVEANDTQGGVIVDSFEFTGLCSNDTTGSGNNFGNDTFVLDGSDLSPNQGGTHGPNFKVNLYFHGWSVTTAEANNVCDSGCVNTIANCTVIGGGSYSVLDHVVIDGSDADATHCSTMAWPHVWHVRDSIFRYTANVNTAGCHDWHDNIFEYFSAMKPTAHGNLLECNNDATTTTANVFYNNIMRHLDPSWSTAGQVGLWFCPNTTPEYWFGNLQYDMVASHGVMWSIVGPPGYPSCDNTGTQKFFNNTIVDSRVDCAGSNDNTGGQYLTVLNNHMINATFTTSGGTCHG
jgi:hypothetical protein